MVAARFAGASRLPFHTSFHTFLNTKHIPIDGTHNHWSSPETFADSVATILAHAVHRGRFIESGLDILLST